MSTTQNVLATYIGLALYVVLYAGYTLYEFLWLRTRTHFVPLSEVNLDTDAVWGPGEGRRIRAAEAEEKLRELEKVSSGVRRTLKQVWMRL